MTNSDLVELQETLEGIRRERYSDIPQELLVKILEIEYENQDDRKDASRKVSKLIEEYLESI